MSEEQDTDADDPRVKATLLLVARLADALLRSGTEQDGNWGWPSTGEELRAIKKAADDMVAGKGLAP